MSAGCEPPLPPTPGAGPAELEPRSASTLDCAICLDRCVFPVELPCNHVFCYLCLKGAAVQSLQQGMKARCSMCRADVPANALSNPTLRDSSTLFRVAPPNQYSWYYECRSGGWWEFEERLAKDLEAAYLAKESNCNLLIAGQIYNVDFDEMIQHRPSHPNIVRRIKRDVASLQKRGIAGIRITARNTSAGAPHSQHE